MQTRKTKIVCSLGPASWTDEVVEALVLAGMNVARLNFSHGDHKTHRESIERVRRVSEKLGVPIAILLDTKGPEIRSGMVENDGKVTINKDDIVEITTDNCLTSAAQGQKPGRISISWKEAAKRLQAGHHVLIADGLLDLEVTGVTGDVIKSKANNTAVIGSKKNVNLTGIHAQLPIMGEQDKADIAFGAEMGIDYIAASFLSFPHEVTEIKKYLKTLNSNAKVIAKIESGEGLENIKEIARLADGVMVARGDLGVQLPTEQIPLAQKHIINICRRAGKPVITATQMLESMIVNPRPTRAELTDVANAIFDGTDAIMLSGETANGAYPVEAVRTMDKIARTVEESQDFRIRMKNSHDECLADAHLSRENLGKMISRSGVETASAINAKAIIAPTLSGKTARMLSVYRPDEPVLAITPNKDAERIMQLYWGVSTHYTPLVDETETMIKNTMKIATDTGIAGIADKIVLVAGLPLRSPYMVNTVRVLILGTVLTRSSMGGYANPNVTRIQGKLIHATTPNDAQEKTSSLKGEILVCKTLTKDYIPVLRIVKGVICEDVSEINDEEICDANKDIIWLSNTGYDAEKLKPGLTVTIDAKQLLVYEGSI
ncbi:MAG: pyruvate kinase [Treponema sp.]|jgi:pyruvate kinase|nr:pyruvate kinase [Treponema sp.]